MPRSFPAVLVVLLVACAGAKVRLAVAQRTDTLVIAKPLDEAWPVVKQVLEDHHFPGSPKANNPYRLETATLTAEGGLPGVETTRGAAMPPRPRAGGAMPAQGRMASAPIDHVGGELMRFTVEGLVVDEGHCRVHIVRHVRPNFDSSESESYRDALMELEVIGRLEPERAEAIRKELLAEGVELP